MTTATQGYAIFGNGIVFHVIDVVNYISVSLAYSAGVIVAFPYLSFEGLVESYRVWLKRFAPNPIIGILANLEFVPARDRTKFPVVSLRLRNLFFKCFPTILASPRSSLLTIDVVAVHGTKPPFTAGFIKKIFSTLGAYVLNFSACPKIRAFPFETRGFRATSRGTIFIPFGLRRWKAVFSAAVQTYQINFSTPPIARTLPSLGTGGARARTIKTSVFSVRRNKITFTAVLAKLFNFHFVTLKVHPIQQVSIVVQAIRAKWDAYETKNLTNRFCLNNSIISQQGV